MTYINRAMITVDISLGIALFICISAYLKNWVTGLIIVLAIPIATLLLIGAVRALAVFFEWLDKTWRWPPFGVA